MHLEFTFNDNTMQTFKKMNTREFSFSYVMAARNPSEEQDIKDILSSLRWECILEVEEVVQIIVYS